MSGHTPGPWKIEFEPDEGPTVYVEATVGRFEIAAQVGGEVRQDKDGDYSDYSEPIANARLIAAAPELLEALKTILHGSQTQGAHTGMSWHDVAGICIGAIAKAEINQ